MGTTMVASLARAIMVAGRTRSLEKRGSFVVLVWYLTKKWNARGSLALARKMEARVPTTAAACELVGGIRQDARHMRTTKCDCVSERASIQHTASSRPVALGSKMIQGKRLETAMGGSRYGVGAK